MHLLLKVRSAYQHVVIIFGNDVRVENIGADAQALEAEEPGMPSEGSGEEHLLQSAVEAPLLEESLSGDDQSYGDHRN
ncbi:hypothetical protein RB195_005286 [Necator americanus]|uniref:Uncharacterized protein n=1 Tax=Necator americanus TaxID=51031 RepID=A0ABR1BQC4_NECAM